MSVGLNCELAVPVIEGGSNYSLGERQLLCLARILVTVAHRLETLSAHDKVIELSGGRIMFQGSPAAAAKKEIIYQNLALCSDLSGLNVLAYSKIQALRPLWQACFFALAL